MRTDREIILEARRRDRVVHEDTAGGPVPYARGARFLSTRLKDWLTYANAAARGALESLDEGLWHDRTRHGAKARASGLAAAADSLAKAIGGEEWDHAVFHALVLGYDLGALGVFGNVDHRVRQYEAARPDIEHGRKFKGHRGGGRKPTVTDDQLRRALEKLQADRREIRPRTRAFYEELSNRVGLTDRQLRARLRSAALLSRTRP